MDALCGAGYVVIWALGSSLWSCSLEDGGGRLSRIVEARDVCVGCSLELFCRSDQISFRGSGREAREVERTVGRGAMLTLGDLPVRLGGFVFLNLSCSSRAVKSIRYHVSHLTSTISTYDLFCFFFFLSVQDHCFLIVPRRSRPAFEPSIFRPWRVYFLASTASRIYREAVE